MSHPTTPLEKVAAVTVNVLLWGRVAEAAGAPPWAGRLFAALSMAAAADDSLPEQWRRVGRVGAAPGALLVSVLREHGIPIVEPDPQAPPTVIDIDQE